MAAYQVPTLSKRPKLKKNQVYLMASGDLRPAANQQCWAEQAKVEASLTAALAAEGYEVVRAHPYKEDVKHGFISSQREGLEVFAQMDPKAPVIVAEAVWQYSHHVLPGLLGHQGPILTCANWSGTWPGLVGMLNLNGCLTKFDKKYTTVWSADFTDDFFKKTLKKWLQTGYVKHPTPQAMPFAKAKVGGPEKKLASVLAQELQTQRAIMGIFDEGCMGMANAIIPEELLQPTGVFKERLSQSALYFATNQVPDSEAKACRKWMEDRGFKFVTGKNEETDLTDNQILTQCKMYIATCRIVDEFGCDVVGIQYQQGLKDLLPASDLVEGMLNNADRPPVMNKAGKIIRDGEPIPHFNEVDECVGLDQLMTLRIHKAMGQPVESTLHDVRWGDQDKSGSTNEYVWVFLISGSVPPAHNKGGWAGSSSERQPSMYFRLGGGTLKGVSKPGEIVWSRVYVEGSKLKMDLGRAAAIELPEEETNRRWQATTPQWPIMHAVLYGIGRDQFMAKHKANHIVVAYANSAVEADKAMLAKATMAAELGLEVNLCGTRKNGKAWS
jgi:L-fucose isomerase-like protein